MRHVTLRWLLAVSVTAIVWAGYLGFPLSNTGYALAAQAVGAFVVTSVAGLAYGLVVLLPPVATFAWWWVTDQLRSAEAWEFSVGLELFYALGGLYLGARVRRERARRRGGGAAV